LGIDLIGGELGQPQRFLAARQRILLFERDGFEPGRHGRIAGAAFAAGPIIGERPSLCTQSEVGIRQALQQGAAFARRRLLLEPQPDGERIVLIDQLGDYLSGLRFATGVAVGAQERLQKGGLFGHVECTQCLHVQD
jgi:hypothetical protein